MGPVDLRAETEAAELDRQINGLQSERAELTAAIARLRRGIAMTMARLDRLFDVTTAEGGVSRLVSVDLQAAVEMRASA